LLKHWLHLAELPEIPHRTDLDPTQFPSTLPIVFLCEPTPDGQTFRHRLAGEDMNALFGCNLRGRVLDDVIHPERIDATRNAFRLSLRERAIVHRIGPIYRLKRAVIAAELLILPLVGLGNGPDSVVGGLASRTVGHGDALPTDGTNQLTAVSVETGRKSLDCIAMPVPEPV